MMCWSVNVFRNNEFRASGRGTRSFDGKLNVYMMEKGKREKTLLEREVGMKELTWSVVRLERTVNRLETKKLVAEAGRGTDLLLVADDYERLLNYVHVAEIYPFCTHNI